MKTKFYKDDSGEYRWQTKASNGEVVGASTEGFSGQPGALDNFFLNHPTLDRNSVQKGFDGNVFVLHN